MNVSDLDEMLAQAGVNTSAAKLNFSAAASTPGRLSSAMAGNASAPASTLSVLNMTGSALSNSAIDALHTAFNQLNGKGAFNTADPKAFDLAMGAASTLAATDPSQAVVATLDLSGQSNQSGAGNHAFSGGTAASDPNLNQNPLNMADTYEKLSNQLASELSRRMNEQISQGQWKMKFALKPSSLGAVDVSLEMKDGKLAAVLQSDNALTQHLLQHGSQQLKDNLSVLGMNQTSVQIGQGSSGGASAGGQGAGNGAQNPFDNNSQNANSINDLTQASSTVADATITGNSNDSLLDTFA
jgi:flagellar hook-length control protein FliK